MATAQADVADVTPRDRRAGALGLVGAAFGLGIVFGPAIRGLFASDPVVAAARDLLPAAVPATSYSLPSFAAAGFSLLALGVGTITPSEPERLREPAAGSRRSWLSTLSRALGRHPPGTAPAVPGSTPDRFRDPPETLFGDNM